MIIAGCCLFCLLYVVFTMRQDFYHAWCWLIAAVAACFLALWSMPELSALLVKLFADGDLKLFRPFCRSTAILLTGVILLIALRITIGKIKPLVDPEFPVWFDRPASFAARLVTSLAIATLLLQSALVLPLAGAVDSFTSTAEKADAVALFGSGFLNRLSGRSSYGEKQRAELKERRDFSRRKAEEFARREREEQAAREEKERQAAEAAAAAAAAAKKNGQQAPEAPPPPPDPSAAESIRSKLRKICEIYDQDSEPGTAETPTQAPPQVQQPNAKQPDAKQPDAAVRQPAAAPPEISGSSVSTPGTVLNRTKSRIRTIYDNHNRNLESGGAAQ